MDEENDELLQFIKLQGGSGGDDEEEAGGNESEQDSEGHAKKRRKKRREGEDELVDGPGDLNAGTQRMLRGERRLVYVLLATL